MRKEVRMMKKELRMLDMKAAGEMTVEGYAAVTGQRTLMYESEGSGYKYFEIIEPGAFDRADMSDVVMRYNHRDAAYVLARTSNGSLRLSVDEKGLRVEADIAATTAGKDMYELIRRGDVSQMSFCFTVGKEAWEEDKGRREITRHINSIERIFDVAPVDFPAYDGTSIHIRNAGDTNLFIEMDRQKRKRAMLIARTYL